MVSVPSAGSTSTRRCSLASACPLGAHRRARSGTLDDAVRAPAEAGHGIGANTTSCTGARRWRMAMVAPASPSASRRRLGRLEVDPGLTGRGVVERELDHAVGERAVLDPGDARRRRAPGPRIISSTQRIFWPTTTVEMPSRLDRRVRPGWGRRCRRRRRPGAPGRCPGAGPSTSPPRCAGGAVHDDGRRRRRVDRGREVPERVAGEGLADVARFLVAHAHRLDDLVVAARARRVVRAVQDELAPADVEERVRVGLGREEQRAQRFGAALERCARPRAAAWCTSTRFDATPISTLARAPDRSSPHHVGRPSVGCSATYSRERRDREVVVVLHRVGRRDDAPEPRCGSR